MSQPNSRKAARKARRKSGKWGILFVVPLLMVLLAAGMYLWSQMSGKPLFVAPTALPTQSAPEPTDAAPTVLPTAVPTAEPTPTPMPTPTPAPTPTPDPFGMYFSQTEEVTIIKDSRWEYRGPDLYVHIEKTYHEDCSSIFFVAHIYTRNYNNIQSGLWEESRGSAAVYPEKLARKYQAVYAQNGDFFADSWNTELGPSLRNGIVYKKKLGPDALAFMPDCSLKMLKNGRDDYSTDAMLAEGIEHTYAFGPIIVEDGQVCEGLKSHSLYRKNPRSGIGMVEPGHFVSILVDGRKPKISYGCTLERLAQEFIAEGCVNAYNLDGGQSTAMVFMGNQINDHKNETTPGQRRLPDMIIIGQSDLAIKE